MSDLATDRFCPGCGYDLRGITSERCPECGTPFDPNEPTEPQIPWSHRADLGRRRAFWRTVKLTTFRTSQFATEINRPVSLADALSFRRAVVWHVFIPAGLMAGLGYLQAFDMFNRPWWPHDRFGSITQWLGLPVMLVSLWLFLLLAFGMLSYFFHPHSLSTRQQNRAVALSYYACAPWAFFFIVPSISLAFAGFAWLMDQGPGQAPLVLLAVIWVVCIVPIVVWVVEVWFVPQQMLRRTRHCSTLRWVVMGFVVHPLGYLLCALLTLGLINLAYWSLVLMIHSLR